MKKLEKLNQINGKFNVSANNLTEQIKKLGLSAEETEDALDELDDLIKQNVDVEEKKEKNNMDKELINKLDQNLEELNQLKQAFASISKKFVSEVKGDVNETSPEDAMNYMDRKIGYIHEMISNLHNRIDRTENMHYAAWQQHTKNHLPPLSASQMEKALKNCGAENDFNVVRPNLYVSSASTKKGLEITASFKKNEGA